MRYLFECERQLFAAHCTVGHAAGSRVLLQLQSLLQRRPGGGGDAHLELSCHYYHNQFGALNLPKTSCKHCLVLTGTSQFVSLQTAAAPEARRRTLSASTPHLTQKRTRPWNTFHEEQINKNNQTTHFWSFCLWATSLKLLNSSPALI